MNYSWKNYLLVQRLVIPFFLPRSGMKGCEFGVSLQFEDSGSTQGYMIQILTFKNLV